MDKELKNSHLVFLTPNVINYLNTKEGEFKTSTPVLNCNVSFQIEHLTLFGSFTYFTILKSIYNP